MRTGGQALRRLRSFESMIPELVPPHRCKVRAECSRLQKLSSGFQPDVRNRMPNARDWRKGAVVTGVGGLY
jgi:hypothetical protein